MRIPCPYCGPRDAREFTCRGTAPGPRPDGETDSDADWQAYLHLRGNPAGRHEEHWHHVSGCRAWLRVTRDTVTHEVLRAEPARNAGGAA